MDKRGISEITFYVMATVFVVVGVFLVWAGISFFLKAGLFVTTDCSLADVFINRYSGYTCYVPNEVTLIQLRKGDYNISIPSIKFYVSDEGDSLYYRKDYELLPNTEKTFYFDSKMLPEVELVRIVPVVKFGKAEKSCSVDEFGPLKVCTKIDLDGKEIIGPGEEK